MLKFIVAAVWIVAATLGAVFYSFQSSSAKPAAEAPPPLLGGLDYVKTDTISVPLVKDGVIGGYFLTKLVYTVDPAEVAHLSVPADSLIVDQVYSYLYGSPHIDFTRAETLDLDAYRNDIRDAINKRVGKELVHEVLVEQVDYLSKEEIRDNAVRRRAVEMKTPTLGKEKKPAKPAH